MPPFLLNLLLQFKTQIIVALAIIGIVLGAWFYHVAAVSAADSRGYNRADSTWTYNTLHAPVKTDTVKKYIDRWYKDTSGVGSAIAQGIDSARKAAMDAIKNKDSALYALSQKQEFKHEITQDSTLRLTYNGYWDPLNPIYKWKISNVFIKEKETIIKSERVVPMPLKPWVADISGGTSGAAVGVTHRLSSDYFSDWRYWHAGLQYQALPHTPIKLDNVRLQVRVDF